MPLIDRHLVFSFFHFYRSFSVRARHLVFHQLSPLLLQEILLIFVLKRRRAPLIKTCGKTGHWRVNCPTHTSLPDQPTNSSKVCQVRTAALLGSSNSTLPEIDDKMADRGSFGALKMATDLIVKCMGKKGKMEFPYLKQRPDYLPRSE